MTYCLSLSYKKHDYDALCGQLYDIEVYSFQEEDATQHNIIKIFDNSLDKLEKILSYLKDDIKFLDAKITTIDHDYLNAWKEFAKPIEISPKSIIVPSWVNSEENTEATFDTSQYKNVINIDPGYAFGSGSHETTLLCLRALESVEIQGKSLLDVGSGSGVLAIFARMLGVKTALGIDIDEQATKSALDNAKQNNITSNISFSIQPLGTIKETYDIVVANILSSILVEFGSTLVERVAKNGHLILSGILSEEVEKVAKALKLRNYTSQSLGEWAMIHCKMA